MAQMTHAFAMNKNAFVHVRVRPEIKSKAEKILSRIGLTHTEAVNMFYAQICNFKGIPFDARIPNKETVQALKDSREKKNLIKADNVNDLLKELNS